MAIREIVTLPELVLRRKARTVTDFGPEFQNLVDDMIETMREAPGVGLAATQIGESIRLIVVEFGDEEDEEAPKKLFVVANPTITRFSEEMVTGIEGCLSVPGFLGDVDRSHSITVRGQNKHGQKFRIKAEDWLARVFQHEIDHLDGILYIDRASRVWAGEESVTQVVPEV